MSSIQLIAKLLNCGYSICGYDEKGEIDLSKDDKYFQIIQKETYSYFGYAVNNKWIVPYKELQ